MGDRIHYAYRIEHPATGRYYIGIRTTRRKERPETDGYMGRGHVIRAAVKKYGASEFTKTILSTFPTRCEACAFEALQVTPDRLRDPLCMNLKTGGLNGSPSSDSVRRMSQSKRGRPLWPNGRPPPSEETLARMRAAAQRRPPRGPCPPGVREKIAAAQRGRPVPQWKRDRISETLRARIAADPAVRQKLVEQGRMTAGRIYGPRTPEHRARISASLRAFNAARRAS